MDSDIPAYLTNNEFVPHPMGNYACYGLNTFGCNSVILYNDELLKFYSFQGSTNNAIYINKDGKQIIININDETLKITRMMDNKDFLEFITQIITNKDKEIIQFIRMINDKNFLQFVEC